MHVHSPIFHGQLKENMFLCMHFSRLFKNIVFRSVALVTKDLWAILDFFHRPNFFPPCTLF